jgi:hypothetical protein
MKTDQPAWVVKFEEDGQEVEIKEANMVQLA